MPIFLLFVIFLRFPVYLSFFRCFSSFLSNSSVFSLFFVIFGHKKFVYSKILLYLCTIFYKNALKQGQNIHEKSTKETR